MQARNKNIGRYPIAPGLVRWFKNGEPLLCGGALGKGGYTTEFGSALMCWENGYTVPAGESNTFEVFDHPTFPDYMVMEHHGDAFFGKATRAINGWLGASRAKVASDYYDTNKDWHFEDTLDSFTSDADGFTAVINTESSLHYSPVAGAQRIVDFDNSISRLRVTDIISGFPPSGNVAMMFNLPSAPIITGNQAVWQSITGDYTLTLVYNGSVPARLTWHGGLNRELLGPMGPRFNLSDAAVVAPSGDQFTLYSPGSNLPTLKVGKTYDINGFADSDSNGSVNILSVVVPNQQYIVQKVYGGSAGVAESGANLDIVQEVWMHKYGKGADPGISASVSGRHHYGLGKLFIQPVTGGQSSYNNLEALITIS